jgi:cytochrome P450
MPALSPPGPKGSWFGGNLGEFRRDRLGFFTRCARDYGDIVALRLGPRRVWLVSDPRLIEEVLVAQSKSFIKHFALRLNPLVLGKGLLTSEGDFWLRQRRLIQPVFQKSRIAAYAPDMVEAAANHVAAWRDGEERDIHAEMMSLTLTIAARTLFHAEVEGEAASVAQAMDVMQQHFVRRFNGLLPIPMWIPTPANLRVRRAVRRLDEVLFRFIRQRREHPEKFHGDLLSLLLQARDEGDGQGMSDQQLRDEAMTLFLAGHETTALTLSWSWYLLARNPDAARKVQEEVERVIGGRTPTADDWPRLKYTEMVSLEAMRLYPPAYVIGREALTDVDLGGHRLPRGTTVLMSQWVVHRDKRFFADPEQFRPERWGEESIKALPKFAYFPFGGGPRLCIGNTFALMEMALLLSVLAQRFDFTLKPGVELTPQPTFTLRPSGPIPALVRRR